MEEKLFTEFDEILEKIRKGRRGTKALISKKSGVSSQNLNKILKTSSTRPETMKKIVDAYNIFFN